MSDELRMDAREVEDIENEIRQLAKSYVPAWKFTLDSPDIGSVIGILYAKQMMENVNRYNTYIDRCHLSYMNMLGVWRKPPIPARMIAVFHPVPDANPVVVEKGTGIVVNTGEDEPSRITFQLCSSIGVTSASIQNIIIADKERLSERVVYEKGNAWKKILLGEESGPEQKKKQLKLFHKSLFQSNGRVITMHIEGNVALGDLVSSGVYQLQCLTKQGMENVTVLRAQKNDIAFQMERPLKELPVDEDGEETVSELVITQLIPDKLPVYFDQITFVSTGEEAAPEFVSNRQIGQDVHEFPLFGDALNMYAECYIGMDAYFFQGDAAIQLDFELEIAEKMVGQRPQPPEDLRIIKRKKRYEYEEVIADAYAQKVLYEYYTEQGWKRLDIRESNAPYLFDGKTTGRNRISFICPEDWIASSLEGYTGRCIRIQLVASEYCYMQPCRHHIPVLRNLQIEYSYENRPQAPQYYQQVDLYGEVSGVWNDSMVEAFSASNVEEDALYIGFQKKPEKGPVSIYIKLEENRSFSGVGLRFEYFSKAGMKQISVIDHTMGGKISGTMVFMPPDDFTESMVGGQKAYYIRIVDVKQGIRNMTGKKPIIENILMNAAEAQNLQTMEEMDFYIENPSSAMKFDLSVPNIYDAEVWVNEIDTYSEAQRKRLVEENPDRYRVEYNPQGKVQNFFVLWDETDSFLNSNGKRVYVLDRINGMIYFGDGVTNPIPRVVRDVAFTVKLRVCNMRSGNVTPYSVEGMLSSMPSIASIENPYAAYGGTDMESVALAQFRGTHVMSSSHRLVTVKDYENAALSFSENIVKAKCTVNAEGQIVLVLLIRDCEDGVSTFEAMKEGLLEELRTHCEMTMDEKDILIQEPMFVQLSVQLWGHCSESGQEDVFALQEEVNNCLTEYLRPVTGNNGAGWNIGELPQKSQIVMKMQFLEKKIQIQNCVIDAKYEDDFGVHEVDAEQLRNNPFVMIKSGTHEVHIL